MLCLTKFLFKSMINFQHFIDHNQFDIYNQSQVKKILNFMRPNLFVKGLVVGAGSLLVSFGVVSLKEKSNQVWAWGMSRNGELGIGSDNNLSLPQMIKNINFADIDTKKSISAGITVDGKLYTWGRNRNGVIGHLPLNLNVLLPREVELQDKVVQISCGYQHMCAVTQKGEVLVWGIDIQNSSFRTIGTSQKQKQAVTVKPTKLDIKDIKQVSCSSDYITLLNKKGQVFLLGKSSIVGKDNKISTNKKDIIQLTLDHIQKVQSGANYSMALTDDGKVYVWGNNTYGQLGTGSLKNQNKPILLDHFIREKVIDISCGDNYSGVITQNGDVYTWGFNNQGQLGHGDKSDQFLPRKINSLKQKVQQISCGGGHTAIITANNKLFMMGRGRQGQLGRQQLDQGSSGNSLKVKQVEQLPKNKKIKKVACGGNHTLVLLQELV